MECNTRSLSGRQICDRTMRLLENPYGQRLLPWLLLSPKKWGCRFKVTAVIHPKNHGVSQHVLLFSLYAFNMLTVFHRISSFSASIHIMGTVLCQQQNTAVLTDDWLHGPCRMLHKVKLYRVVLLQHDFCVWGRKVFQKTGFQPKSFKIPLWWNLLSIF